MRLLDSDQQNVLTLRDNFYFWMAFALISMIGVSIASRWWLQKRIQREIETLMNYTHKLMDLDTKSEFIGSKIYEFDYFGRTLEQSFRRLANKEKQFEDLFNFALSPTMLWNTSGRLIRMNPQRKSSFCAKMRKTISYLRFLNANCCRPSLRRHRAIIRVTSQPKWMVVCTAGTFRRSWWKGRSFPSLLRGKISPPSRKRRNKAKRKARSGRVGTGQSRVFGQNESRIAHAAQWCARVSQLLKRTPLNDEQREHVAVLCSSGEHLLAVLNDILDFSRLEQGKFRIQKNEFRLKELVCAIDRIYRPLCNEKGLELVVNSNITTAAIVRSDQIRINQILFNLLNNAIKFTHQGSIRVELQLIEGDPLAQLVIQVVDTGIGIREQDLTVIFEPFMQAESTTTREYGGSGLGLTIVHSLVEMLSGQLHVSSSMALVHVLKFSYRLSW